jgi:uncharacterized protein (DUF302 family)
MIHPTDVIVKSSPFGAKETIDRIQGFLRQHGATIYVRVDQQKEMERVGLTSGPLEYLLFGNPKAGGLVMQENPVAAIALPLKVIAWEDTDKKGWVAFYSGDGVAADFGISAKAAGPLHLAGMIDAVFGNK